MGKLEEVERRSGKKYNWPKDEFGLFHRNPHLLDRGMADCFSMENAISLWTEVRVWGFRGWV